MIDQTINIFVKWFGCWNPETNKSIIIKYSISTFLILGFFFFAEHLKAQDTDSDNWVRIIGSIVDDSTGYPVPYAHIIDTKLNKGASADNKGNFNL